VKGTPHAAPTRHDRLDENDPGPTLPGTWIVVAQLARSNRATNKPRGHLAMSLPDAPGRCQSCGRPSDCGLCDRPACSGDDDEQDRLDEEALAWRIERDEQRERDEWDDSNPRNWGP